jgi:2-oxoglutarate ferredoxin oxidoreductase subunit alpha
MQYTWKIGGEAGFGIMTTGLLFAKIAARRGYFTFDFVEYPSLIRGGHNAYDVTIGDEEITVLKSSIDLLICLNKETFDLHKTALTSDAVVIYDKDMFQLPENVKGVHVPFTSILKEMNGLVIMKNMIALGASLALMGSDLQELHDILQMQFGKKGADIVALNQQFAQKGSDIVTTNYKDYIKPILQKRDGEKKMIISGNEAFAYGAVAADCRFYAAYPMTPSSSVLTTLAAWAAKTGMMVRHSEDEIAVINSALGASFTGVRSAVGTSGGGFALMVEAVSMAGVIEQPIVIFLSQRPGPATGMPTWTEQGDLLFAVHAGHGEFQKIVLAPGDHAEMVEMTIKAFDLADIYQVPVIVMSDMLLSESHKSISLPAIQKRVSDLSPKRGKLIDTADKNYKRYEITQDGISPRLIPGAKGMYYQANSYEHLEDSHTTESAEERIKQVDKRARKWKTYLENDFTLPTLYGKPEDAEVVFIGWGSTKGVAVEAVKRLGGRAAYVHFSSMYPLHKEKVRQLLQPLVGKCILVENNSTALFGQLLQMETGIMIEKKLLRYDGRAITVEQIMQLVGPAIS